MAASPRPAEGGDLLQRLREETAPAHARIEAALGLERICASPAAYRALLCRFHGFHAAWEPQAAALLGTGGILAGRTRLHLLADDLQALGMDAAQIRALPCPSRADLMPLDRPGQALGALYVMEGSTLGGAVISAHVRRSLGYGPGTGCSYFATYGARRGAMWQAFRTALPREPGAEEVDAVTASAHATFAALQHWLP